MEDPRFRVRRMFESRIEGLDEFKLPDLTDDIMAEVKADADLLAAFVEQEIRRMVYVVGQDLLGQWRRAKERDGEEIIDAGASLMTRRALQRKAFARRLDWLRHYEQAGDRQVNVMKMTKSDCLLAVEARGRRADTERQYVRFFRTVAQELSGGEAIEDKFTPGQLQRIFEQCAIKKAGRPAAARTKTA